MMRVYIHKDVRSWATWDHYPIYSRVEDDEHKKCRKGRERRNGPDGNLRPLSKTFESKKKKVMEKNDDKTVTRKPKEKRRWIM